jgi:phage tail-like protein
MDRLQIINFHFEVSFSGLGKNHPDGKFQSVSGLEMQFDTETIKEGGENRFEHVIPVRRKVSDLVLKRGIMILDDKSLLTGWLKNAFDENEVRPLDLNIILLNENHDALAAWKVIHAWPKSWKVGELNAEKGEILIETLELAYNRLVFIDANSEKLFT